MTSIAKALASHGYFVMNVTYRLTPNWQYPAPIDDLAEAVRYLRHHAKQLNIDPQRIATFGYSAGGHLAALIGLDPRNQIDAIVAGGAPTNMAFWPNGEMSSLFLGGPLRGNEAVYRAASPVSHVTRNSPPVFIYHGTGDQLVPIEHPQALIAQLKKYNVPHEVYWLEGKSHVKTHLFPADSISKAITFLDQHVR